MLCQRVLFESICSSPVFLQYIKKEKKSAEFLTLGISHPSSIWSLSPKAVAPQHLPKIVVDAPEYDCSYLVSFWGVLPMFRGKLLFLKFQYVSVYKKMTTDLGHPDSFRECCTFFLSSNGCSLKNRLKSGEFSWWSEDQKTKNAEAVKWSEEYQNLRSKRLLSVLNDLNGHMQRQDRPSKHQKSYRPSFGLSVRANGTSPVKPTKLQVLHTCTKKLKDHKGIDFLCCFFHHGISLHCIFSNDHKRFCWNKCFVMGFFKKKKRPK